MRASILVWLGAAAAILAMAGCGRGIDSWQKQIISEDNPDQRREAVLELMQTRQGKSDGGVRLFALLAETDVDPTVRSAATQALGESGNPTAVDPLTRVLAKDADGQVRRDAAAALYKINGPEAVRPLLNALREDPLNEVRATCARALAKYPYPGVVQALVAALLSDDFSVFYEAQKSLKELTARSFETTRQWQSWLDEQGDPYATVKIPAESSK